MQKRQRMPRQKKMLRIQRKKKFRNIIFSLLLKMEQHLKSIHSRLGIQRKQNFIWKEAQHILYLTAPARRNLLILWKTKKLWHRHLLLLRLRSRQRKATTIAMIIMKAMIMITVMITMTTAMMLQDQMTVDQMRVVPLTAVWIMQF